MRAFFITTFFLISFTASSQGISKTYYLSNSRYLFSLDFKQTSVSNWSAGNLILREYFNGEKIKTTKIDGTINSQEYYEMGEEEFYFRELLVSIHVDEKKNVHFDARIESDLDLDLSETDIKLTEVKDGLKRYYVLGDVDSTGRQLVLTYEEEFFVDTLHNRLESQGAAFVSERYLEPSEVVDASGNI